MRYMFLVMSTEEQAGPPPRRLIEEINKATEIAMSDGSMVGAGGLMPISQAVRVRVKGSKLIVTDGPFAESKEVLGGYAIFDLPSREAAIESMKQFMELHLLYGEGWEGVCEMREMYGQSAPDVCPAVAEAKV
jgi:hypothetical protein